MNIFSEISLWWAIPLLILGFSLSAFYYFWKAHNSVFSLNIRRILFLLRGIGLTLIFWLLLGILYQSVDYRTEKPVLIIALDGSNSMLNYKDSTYVKNEIPIKLDELKSKLSVKFQVKEMTFSEGFNDSLDYSFSGKSSNLSLPFSHIRHLFVNKNVGGIIFISDGNYNEGIHPVFEAEKLSFVPVFGMLVGDTTTKRDAQIVDLVVNQIAFSGNIFPVKVETAATKMEGKLGRLKLFVNNKLIKEENLIFKSNQSSLISTFQVEAVGKGIQSIRAELVTDEKEYTLSNNTRTVYVEVLESKRKVDIIAGGIHPDIGALQSVLQKDKNTHVKVHLAKNLTSIPKSDLIIFHNPSTNVELWKQLNNSNTAFLAILSSNSDASGLNLGLSGQVRGRTDMVNGAYNSNFSAIRFSAEFEKRIKDFPPLSVPYSKSINEMGASLFFQKIGSVVTDKPLLTFFERGENKGAVLYGDGIWRWKLSEYSRYQNNLAFEEMWDKILQYLTVKRNTDKLRIFTPSKTNDRDEIVFRAEFYNDAFQQIVEPNINFEILDKDDNKLAGFVFQPRQVDYILNIGKLKAGIYKWKASTSFGGKKYEKTGDLIISESTMESLNLTSNYALMNELSEQTNGGLFNANDWDKLTTTIENREDITSVKYEELNYNDLIDYKWLFFLIIALFSAEWIIRRWSGSF